MRRHALPGALLLGLLGWSGIQIADDFGHRPGFVTRGGLPVSLSVLEEPPSDALEACWPSDEALAAELPELIAVEPRLGALEPCSAALPTAVVIDAWPGGRFVWRRGERLELQRW